MKTLTRTLTAADAEAERAWEPRDDVVVERADGPDRFTAASGPFAHYERRLQRTDAGVDETIDVAIAPLVWGPFPYLYRLALRSRPSPGRSPWWFPPQTPDAHGATSLGGLTLLAMILAYLGSLLTQTITFAAEDFGVSRQAQTTALIAARIGVLGALVIATAADRLGRRRVLLGLTAGAVVLTVLCAFAPNLVVLSILQAGVRGFVTSGTVLLTIVAAEEMPSGSRAFAISLISVTGALGVGILLLALPLADHGESGWRAIYLLAILFVPLLRWIAREMPESRRFAAVHVEAPMAGHGRRFWLLAVSALLLALFTAPATQLMNDFLRDERGFTGARIALFTIITNVPGGIGIVVGGRLADTRGRRVVGAIGTAGGVLLTVAMVLASGWSMWVLSALGAVIGAMVVPAIGVYGPELFPTSLRGRANGTISILGVTGSVTGLFVAGRLLDRWDHLGPALALLAIGPMIMSLLVLLAYPETAHRELEDLNPEDRPTEGSPPAAPRPPVH